MIITDPYQNFNVASMKRNFSSAVIGNPYLDTYVLNNQTVTTSSSQGTILETQGANIIELHAIVTGTVSGTSPSIVFTLSPYDPKSGVALSSSKKTTTAITATGSDQEVRLDALAGDISCSQVIVSWTVSGTSPSFGGVYCRVLARR